MGKIVKYKMEMEVLTPVHIAGADYKSKLNKTEYIFNPNTNDLTIIDNNKFVNFLVEKKIIDKYLDEIRKNNKLNLFYFLKNSDLYKNKDRNKILYEDLRGFTKKSYKNLDIELKIKENIDGMDMRVISEPTLPLKHSWPRKLYVMMVGGLLYLVIAGGFIYIQYTRRMSAMKE